MTPDDNWNRFDEDSDEYNEEFIADPDADELDLPGYVQPEDVY